MARTVATPASYVAQEAIAFGAPGSAAIAVDATRGLPVESSAEGSAAATIAANASLTDAIDLDRQRLHRIAIPAGWTTAGLSFQSSPNGTSWNDLYDMNGEVTVAAGIVAPGRAIVLDPAVFFGIRYLRVRSGTAAAPVAQAAARALVLATVAR